MHFGMETRVLTNIFIYIAAGGSVLLCADGILIRGTMSRLNNEETGWRHPVLFSATCFLVGFTALFFWFSVSSALKSSGTFVAQGIAFLTCLCLVPKLLAIAAQAIRRWRMSRRMSSRSSTL